MLAGDRGFCDRDRGCRAQFPAKRLTSKLAGLAATGAVRSLEVAVLDQITGEALPELPGGAAAGIYPRAGNRCRTAKGAESGRAAGAGQAALPASWLEDVLTTTV